MKTSQEFKNEIKDLLSVKINDYWSDLDDSEIERLLNFPFGVQPAPDSNVNMIFRLVLSSVESTKGSLDGIEYLRHSISVVKNIISVRTDKINEGRTGVGTMIDHAIYEIMKACEPTIVKRRLTNPASNAIQIMSTANRMALETRRGPGNHIIGNSTMIDEVKNFIGGSLDLTYNVVDHIEDNTIIIGYKGGNGQCDCGIILAPFSLRTEDNKVSYGISVPETTKSYYKVLKFQ